MMTKHFFLVFILAALADCPFLAAQPNSTSGTACYQPLVADGLLEMNRDNFDVALNFFQAAQACNDLTFEQIAELDALIYRAQDSLRAARDDARYRENLANTQARINRITTHAYNNIDANPTLAVRLANEACRLSHNGSDLAVRARRQLLEKKNTTFYRTNLDCGCMVYALDVSPDSRYVAIGCYNSGVVKLYDRQTGDVSIVGSHDGKSHTSATMVYRVLFDPKGERLLSASTDGTVKLWNLADSDFELLKTYKHDGNIGGIAFSPFGDSIITASENKVYLYRARGDYARLHTYQLPDEVRGLAFSPDGTLIACGMKNFSSRILQLREERKYTDLIGHTQAVTNVQFSPDGTLLLTGSADHTAKLWEVRSGGELFTYEGHEDRIFAVDFSSDGTYILTGSMDNSAKVWDRNGACLLTLPCSKVFYGTSTFAPNDEFLVTGDFGQHVRFWPLEFESFKNNRPHTSNISALAVPPEADVVLTGSTDHRAKIWDLQTAEVVWNFEAEDEVVAADWSANGERFMLGLWNGTVHLFDRNRNLLGTFKRQHTSSVMSVAMSPDGKRYITGGRDAIAKLWKIDANNQARYFNTIIHTKEVSTVAWSPDGKLVATGSWDGTVKIGPWANAQSMKTLKLPYGVLDVRFSPNSRNLLVCCIGGTAKIFTVEGNEVQDFEMDTRINITAGEFSSTGDTVLLGGRSGWVRLWIRGKKEWEKSEVVHTDGISAIRRVGPDRFVTAGMEGRARLYKYDFTPLRIFRGHLGDINHGAVSPGGKGFITTSTDRSVKQWTLNNLAWYTLHARGKITALKPLLPDGKKVLVASFFRRAGLLSRFDTEDAQNPVELARFPGSITAVDCSANDSLYVVCDDFGTVRVYVASGDTLRMVRERTLDVPAYAVAISATGKYVVIGSGGASDDQSAFVYLWDLQHDTMLIKLPHISSIRAVAFPPEDSTYFASGDDQGFIKFWRISDGALIKTLSNEQDTTLTLSFSPNGKYLLSVDNEDVARIWDASENPEAVYHLMQYLLEDDEVVDAGFLSNDSLVVFGRRLGGVILINPLELLDRKESPIAPLTPQQRTEFSVEYETSVCLSSTNPQEVLECATTFAEEYRDTEDEEDLQKAKSIYERLFELTPNDFEALEAAHELYALKIDRLGQQEGPPDYLALVDWSATLTLTAQRLYQIRPTSANYQDKLNTACWNYSWFLILTGDFAKAYEYAQIGLAMPSMTPQQYGIVCNKVLAELMLADTEAKYQAVAKEYRDLMHEKWIDDRYPTYYKVFQEDFKSLLEALPNLAQTQKDKIKRIQREVLIER